MDCLELVSASRSRDESIVCCNDNGSGSTAGKSNGSNESDNAANMLLFHINILPFP